MALRRVHDVAGTAAPPDYDTGLRRADCRERRGCPLPDIRPRPGPFLWAAYPQGSGRRFGPRRAGGWLGRFADETYRAASDVRALMPPRDFVAGPVRAARIN